MKKGFHLKVTIHSRRKVVFHSVFHIHLSNSPCLRCFACPLIPGTLPGPGTCNIFFLVSFSPHPSETLHFILIRWELRSWIQLMRAVPNSSWYSLSQCWGCIAWFPCLQGASFHIKHWTNTFLCRVFWQTGERKPGFTKSQGNDPRWQSFDVVVHWHKEAIEH